MEESTGMTSASSSDKDVLIFGSNKASEENESGSVEAQAPEEEEIDSDVEFYEEDREEEEEEKKEKRKYNLKMWIDLRKIKPRFKKAGDSFGINIIYVSQVQECIKPGEFRVNTVVDQAEIWMDDKGKAKTIFGVVQDAVNRNAQEVLDTVEKEAKEEAQRMKKQSLQTIASTDTETDTDTTTGTSETRGLRSKKKASRSSRTSGSSTGSGTGSKRRNLARAKRTLKATSAHMAHSGKKMAESSHMHVLTMQDVSNRYMMFTEKIDSEEQGVADHDEGKEAEFTVDFKNSQLGLSLSSGPKIEPFVCRVVPDGLAEISGVALADRVIAINDVEITPEHDWKQAVKIITQEKSKGHLKITFRRKQKNEIGRLKKIEEEERIKKEVEAQKEEELVADNTDGSVEAIEAPTGEGVIGSSRSSGIEDVSFRRKTDDGSNLPKYTLRRKSKKGRGKRNFRKKFEIMQNMKHTITNIKDFKDFKKNKAQMFQLFDNIDCLFENLLLDDYLTTKEEKICIRAVKEIYDTEYKYNTHLNSLRGFHMALVTAKKNVACCHLKKGSAFCEHRRPRRMCKQESSYREPAIDPKEINGIFLNVKPIIKSNRYLWNNLQKALGELYSKLEGGTKVQVHEVLIACSKCFSEIAPYFAMYWNYCQRYTGACEKQRVLRQENKYFAKVVSPMEKTINMKLPNLLSKPVQRITKYHLLFDTLRKHAIKYIDKRKQQADYDPSENTSLDACLTTIEEACASLTALGKKVNSKVGEADGLDQMVEVYQEIGGKEKIANLLQPHRRFDSRYDDLAYENEGLKDNEPRVSVYLFNDMLAIAAQRDFRNNSLGGSKLSFPLRALKMGMGNGRATSFTSRKTKKLSTSSGVSSSKLSKQKKKSETRKKTSIPKKTSLGATTTKHSPPRQTSNKKNDSKGSKDDILYDVLMHVKLKNIGSFKKTSKTIEEMEMFTLEFHYTRKHPNGEKETSKLKLSAETEEMRDKVYDLILKLKEDDAEKSRKQREIVSNMRKVKKKNFHKKRDKFKKQSMKGKSKSSIYSKGSLSTRSRDQPAVKATA